MRKVLPGNFSTVSARVALILCVYRDGSAQKVETVLEISLPSPPLFVFWFFGFFFLNFFLSVLFALIFSSARKIRDEPFQIYSEIFHDFRL